MPNIKTKRNIALVFILMLMQEEQNVTSSNSFRPKFQLIRGNATSYTIEQVDKKEDLMYPGNNPHIQSKVQAEWQKYYLCLQEKEFESKKPEIVRLIEGQFTEFKCTVCPRPFQSPLVIEWKYKPLIPDLNFNELEHLDLTPEMTLSEDQTLQIFNVAEDLAGLYTCYQGKNVVSVYILEVSKNDTIEKVATSYSQKAEKINIQGTELEIYYKWTKWTDCSSCQTVGRKFKYGHCFVKSSTLTVKNTMESLRKGKSSETLDSDNAYMKKSLVGINLNKRKNFIPETTKDKSMLISEEIAKFETGVPCASPILPSYVLESTKKFKSVKTVVKLCLIQCPESELFEVLDSFGNVIEIANNSAGIYSSFQKLPLLPSEIERKSLEEEVGKDIIMQCPGTLHTTIPITWKVNQKIIFPQLIANNSNGRFVIDLVNRIQIKKLRSKDNHIYSCWQRDKLLGTINLNVGKKFTIGFNHHITLLGIVAVVGTFLFVAFKAVNRQMKSRKK